MFGAFAGELELGASGARAEGGSPSPWLWRLSLEGGFFAELTQQRSGALDTGLPQHVFFEISL